MYQSNKDQDYRPLNQQTPINTMSYPNYPNYNQQAPQAYPQSYPPQSYPPPYSPESGQQGLDFDNAFGDKTVRRGFIRKVYSILCLQLLLSLGSVVLFSQR